MIHKDKYQNKNNLQTKLSLNIKMIMINQKLNLSIKIIIIGRSKIPPYLES